MTPPRAGRAWALDPPLRTALVVDRPYSLLMELIILLGTLTAFTPLSVDMYLPALPTIASTFSAEPGQAQLSLASFFLGLAIGQAFYGPISDRFGRKRPLYAGLCLFVLSSAGCALTTSINTLIVLRFFQALGACSGQVIVRAVVRDLFEAREAVRVFSSLLLVMGVSPVLAPLLGGQIFTRLGWRAIFWLLAGLGAIGLVAAVWRLEETHRPEAARSLALNRAIAGYWQLLRDRSFVGYALTGAMGISGMFAYIVGSAFVFIELFHVRPDRFGFFFGLNALGMILSAQINVRLTRRFETDAVIGKVLVLQTTAGLLLMAATLAGLIGLYGTAVLLFIYVATIGCLFPNTTALAMASQGKRAGTASALVGTLQFTLAAVAASLVGAGNNETAGPMAVTVGACGIFAFLLYRFLVRRGPRSQAAIGESTIEEIADG
jgi:DHA1 family bicyclomycin/chloramphenicol resistance-like MFS transporter